MKKENLLLLIICLLLISILSIQKISAEISVPTDTKINFGNNISFDPTTLPSDPEQIQSDFLKQKWGEIILKDKNIAATHAFLQKYSMVFTILFAHKYEISLLLIGIIILWITTAVISSKMISSFGLLSGFLSFLAGIIIAIILAQTRLLEGISQLTLKILYSQETWWIRLIMWLVAFVIIAALYISSGIISKRIKEDKKKKMEEETKQRLKEIKTFGEELKS